MGDWYTVDKVISKKPWQSRNGEMMGWKIVATNGDGEQQEYEINSKPENSYKAGDSFYAEKQEGKYGPRLKREKAPDGSRAPVRNGTPAPQPGPANSRTGMPYADAIGIYKKVARDLGYTGPVPHEWVTSVLIGINRGDIQKPLIDPTKGVMHDDGSITPWTKSAPDVPEPEIPGLPEAEEHTETEVSIGDVVKTLGGKVAEVKNLQKPAVVQPSAVKQELYEELLVYSINERDEVLKHYSAIEGNPKVCIQSVDRMLMPSTSDKWAAATLAKIRAAKESQDAGEGSA